jgi:hypothetical protein
MLVPADRAVSGRKQVLADRAASGRKQVPADRAAAGGKLLLPYKGRNGKLL